MHDPCERPCAQGGQPAQKHNSTCPRAPDHRGHAGAQLSPYPTCPPACGRRSRRSRGQARRAGEEAARHGGTQRPQPQAQARWGARLPRFLPHPQLSSGRPGAPRCTMGSSWGQSWPARRNRVQAALHATLPACRMSVLCAGRPAYLALGSMAARQAALVQLQLQSAATTPPGQIQRCVESG